VEEVRSAGVKMDEDADGAVPTRLVQALLDTGCLVGDCISQEVVNSLNARHLVVKCDPICSGLITVRIPSIVNIKITLFMKTFCKFSQEKVYILQKPVDIIIGKKTIKDIDFINPLQPFWKINLLAAETGSHLRRNNAGDTGLYNFEPRTVQRRL
jgi:hypothetical protein